MVKDNYIQVFLELVRAGLWEKDVELRKYRVTDFTEIMRMAEEQSVIGLVAAGIEHLDVRCLNEDGRYKPSKEDTLQIIGEALQIEQRNTAMNKFIAEMIDNMRQNGIDTLLVKGQGIAQCYERPLWRVSGDVDLLLSDENYKKAKDFLVPLSTFQKVEGRYSRHLGLNIPDSQGNQQGIDQTELWYVELHGTLRTGLAARVDEIVDAVQRDVFFGGNVRSWDNDGTRVFLPAPDNDVIFVFTHFLKHFYRKEMTIRQICDWTRLLWTYRESLNHELLESRIKKSGLMKEWKSFAALAVNYLGMPEEAMPLYSTDKKWHVKGEKITRYVLENNVTSKIGQTLAIAKIFPVNTIKFAPSIFFHLNLLKIKERVFGNGNR